MVVSWAREGNEELLFKVTEFRFCKTKKFERWLVGSMSVLDTPELYA
jgi:hypothetical protein